MLARRVGALIALLFALTAIAAPAALARSDAKRAAPSLLERAGDRPEDSTPNAISPFDLHGTPFGHLPAVQENIEIVSKLNLIHPQTGQPVVEAQVADVAVHKGYAYLNAWDSVTCEGGGTFVVDIRNPAAPRQVSFIPALEPYYHGEGAHVVSISTPQFTGDILAVNDETYGSNVNTVNDCEPDNLTRGGFDLYDVSDPANPRTLVQVASDQHETSATDDTLIPNSYHSVFVWQDGPRAYLVASDNVEFNDVDIFDITDPRNPELIADLDPTFDLPEGEQIVSLAALGGNLLHHDVVVKRIAGQMRMLVSYWDAGYLQLNVDDPADPKYITDTNFDEPDTLTGFDPPEGNAHQAEYSHDNQFFLAADEDFRIYRADDFSITTGEDAGEYPSSQVPGGQSVVSLPDRTLNGPVVYGGYGCDMSAPVPLRAAVDVGPLAAGEEAILVLQRGPVDDPSATEEACFPGEKAANADEAGWDAVLLVNRHHGNADLDDANCGSGGFDRAVIAVCTTHEAFHRLFGTTPNFDLPVPAGDAPPLGTVGERISADSIFDGWGYAHLYDANTSEEIGAFAIPEALDERYAEGFGDLTIHEFATDPETNLAYASYYAGGLRVFRFSRAAGLEQVGAFIDPEGSNIWGVEQFTDAAGNRLIAASDRDFGLVIAKYTGPGAVLAKPPAPPAPAPLPPKAVPASFFKFGSLKRLTIRNRRASATITVPGAGTAKVVLKGRVGKRVMTLGRTTATATRAGSLRLTVRVSASTNRLLRRTLARRSTRRTSGVLQVTFTATGGTGLTRNKSVSIGVG